jgi:hypothetical protein
MPAAQKVAGATDATRHKGPLLPRRRCQARSEQRTLPVILSCGHRRLQFKRAEIEVGRYGYISQDSLDVERAKEPGIDADIGQ